MMTQIILHKILIDYFGPMVIAVLLILLSILLCWLLSSPITLEMDTRLPEAQLRWKGICAVRLVYEKEQMWLYLRTLFIKKKWQLKGRGSKRAGGKNIRGASTRRKKRRRGIPFSKMIRVLQTFRVDVLSIALDTGDPVLNAQLYPLTFFPFRAGRTIRINFEDCNYVLLRISNRPWRALAAWLF